MLQRVVYIFTFWRHLNLGPTYLWQACQERPEPSRLAASYPPHSRGGPRSETQSSSLPKPFCSSCTLPWLVHASTTFGHRTSQGLCTSALPRGRFLLPSSEPGSKCTTSREWLPGPAPAWTPQGSDPGVEPSCQSCYIFVLFHCSSLPTPPPFPDWFYKSKLLRWPRKWGGGARKMTSWGRWGWVRSWGFFLFFCFAKKAWVQWSGSSGALLSGTLKYVCPVWKGPWICPSPHPLLQPCWWQRQRRSELIAHFSLERKTCHLALRRRFHLMLIVHYLYHVLGYHI